MLLLLIIETQAPPFVSRKENNFSAIYHIFCSQYADVLFTWNVFSWRDISRKIFFPLEIFVVGNYFQLNSFVETFTWSFNKLEKRKSRLQRNHKRSPSTMSRLCFSNENLGRFCSLAHVYVCFSLIVRRSFSLSSSEKRKENHTQETKGGWKRSNPRTRRETISARQRA